MPKPSIGFGYSCVLQICSEVSYRSKKYSYQAQFLMKSEYHRFDLGYSSEESTKASEIKVHYRDFRIR
nr:hypothetical protein Iba_chr11cCG11780 [Ipomoea batatas]